MSFPGTSAVLGLALVTLTPVNLALQDPVGSVEVEVEIAGPRSGARLFAGFEETHLGLHLAPGETRRFRAPFLSRARLAGEWSPPRLVGADPIPGIRILPESVAPPPNWSHLPSSLQSRGLPGLRVVRPVLGVLQLAWVGAALLFVLGLRRRPWVATGVGLLAGLSFFWLPGPVQHTTVTRVLEGDAESGRWLEVTGARDRLALSGTSVGWLRHLPQGVQMHLEVTESEGEFGWAICAPGARIYYLRENLAQPLPTRASSAGYTFLEAWMREAGGGWMALGPWTPGESLPAPVPAGEAPPGWLVAGLPQGVPILTGKLEDRGELDSWLRLVGFE